MTLHCREELLFLATRQKLCFCCFSVVVVVEGNTNIFHSWEAVINKLVVTTLHFKILIEI